MSAQTHHFSSAQQNGTDEMQRSGPIEYQGLERNSTMMLEDNDEEDQYGTRQGTGLFTDDGLESDEFVEIPLDGTFRTRENRF